MGGEAEIDRSLHERLLAGDPLASEEVASRHLERVRRYVRSLGARWGVYDEDLIDDAVVDAVLDYVRHPKKFDPKKAGLGGYLNMAARRDFINAVEKDRRHRSGEELTADVELARRSGKQRRETVAENPEVEAASEAATASRFERLLGDVKAPRDRRLIQLIRTGERRTAVFAEILEIGDLPHSEQARIVKQHKDRLKQQLKRAARKSHG